MVDLDRLLKFKKKSNALNFVPRQTLSVNINGVGCYISLICNDNFRVQVVLLNKNNEIIYNILEIEEDYASITKLQDKLYVFTYKNAYIFDINNLREDPLVLIIDDLELQGICSNENNIFAYSISKDKIIKYDKDLIPIEEYENMYSKNNLRVSVHLTCNHDTFFSIPIMSPTEEQYVAMKRVMENCVGEVIASQNDMINSCSYNNKENTLYISMKNIIWIIKEGTEISYLYFKDKTIISSLYDNDINKLIINFGGNCNNHLNGSIIKMSNSEIQDKEIVLSDNSLTIQNNEWICTRNLIEDANGAEIKKR